MESDASFLCSGMREGQLENAENNARTTGRMAFRVCEMACPPAHEGRRERHYNEKRHNCENAQEAGRGVATRFEITRAVLTRA